MRQLISRLLAKAARWKPAGRETGAQSQLVAARSEEPVLLLFSPAGNCASCCHYRSRTTDSGKAEPQQGEAVCAVRGFDVHEPLNTFCKNFNSGNEPPFGAIYTILPAHNRVALPWVGLAVPRVAQATCCLCGERSEAGIRLELAEGNVECCGPAHYLDWWTDYLKRRLEYFKQLGEKAYSDMYDVVSSSAASACYSDAKEAFYSAIATARNLELPGERLALEERLAHIKAVFRSQFR